jgi:acetyltransferase-like isoleucine patch superfamily enzyme/acyl carrier protein
MSAASRLHGALHRATRALQRGTAAFRLRGVDELGPGARTVGAPHVVNRGRIEIGADFYLCSEPVRSHLVTSARGRIVIGNGVTIGAGAAITSHAEIRIGDGVRIGRQVMILDTDFHEAGNMAKAPQPVPVLVEAGARIDDQVVVLKGARIGKGAWVARGSVVTGAVPAGAFVRGVPARAVRDAGSRHAASDVGDVGERVRAVVAETFAVDRRVHMDDGPGKIARWDSLGQLRLLLALEDEFGVTLDERAIHGAQTVAELVDVVARATI